MNLHGSIKDLQSKLAKLYLKLEQHFSENSLILDLWSAMANDVTQQAQDLNALPQSFWNQLKKEHNLGLIEVIDGFPKQTIEIEEDLSLRGCFNSALLLEEPTITKVYAPLIRRMRKNLTAPSLDFYIAVKAHIARITRATRSFSGDPIIIQQSNSLLQSFEKEVQEPHIEVLKSSKKKKVSAKKIAKPQKSARKSLKIRAKARPLAKPTKILHRRSKPLVKKVRIASRRARR